MSKCEEIFDKIEIDNKIEVDCFQNLLISYLAFCGMNTDELKFVWPYSFVKINNENESILRIENNDAISSKRIKKYYGADCELTYFDRSISKLEIIKGFLNRDKVVFVCIDEYYVPYHYKHIYLKHHGVHTVLVTNIDEKNNSVQVVSAIPYFKGNISLECFIKGLDSDKIKQWYCVLDEKKLVNYDKNTLDKYKRESILMIEKSEKIIYTEDILFYITNLKEEEKIESISELCNGTWGWKITKKGEILIEYINSIWGYCSETQDIVDLINKLNSDWTRAYKLLYKSVISQDGEYIKRAIKYLREECKNEIILKEKLLCLLRKV